MTPTQKQLCIAEQSVYGDLQCKVKVNHFEYKETIAIVGCKEELVYLGEPESVNVSFVKPILRPISDLTKSITHKGYNNNEPFVPADIINKMEIGTYAINLGIDLLRPRRHIKENDILHLWHFDTRNLIEKGEAISTDTINPYEVK